MIRVGALIALAASVASADPAADEPSGPDRVAEESAKQANLESNSPHDGFTATAGLVGGLVLGDGVGRGPGGTFRVGYRKGDVTETLELTGASLLHAPPGSATLYNNELNLMIGAQFHVTPSLWLRGATGLTTYTTQDPLPMGNHAYAGGGVLVSFGVALVRTKHFMLGFEGFTVASLVKSKGLMVATAAGLSVSYY